MADKRSKLKKINSVEINYSQKDRLRSVSAFDDAAKKNRTTTNLVQNFLDYDEDQGRNSPVLSSCNLSNRLDTTSNKSKPKINHKTNPNFKKSSPNYDQKKTDYSGGLRIGRFSSTEQLNDFSPRVFVDKKKTKNKIFGPQPDSNDARQKKIDLEIFRNISTEKKAFTIVEARHTKNEKEKESEGGFFGMILGFLGCSQAKG